MPDFRIVSRWAALAAISAASAAILSFAGFPAAFLLGPMLTAIGFGVTGTSLAMPRLGFLAAQSIIGCLVAQVITSEFLRRFFADGAIIVPVVLVTIAAGAAAGIVLTRLRILPGTTAAWGSAPGGAAAMVALSEAHGSDPRLVAFMQYLRVAAVVLTASIVARLLVDGGGSEAATRGEPLTPFAVLATLAVAGIGGGIGFALRLPAGALIGPMLLGSVLHAVGLVSMQLPALVLDCAYAGIGWYVGLRFTRETLSVTWQALPGVLIATFSVILLCGGGAFALTYLLPIDFLTAFLATSPGGLDSVAIIAVGAKADVSFVLCVQSLRLFVVLLIGPWLARWIARTATNSEGGA